MTRRLTIRTKLAAALAVPLIALSVFAAVQVRDAFDAADEVGRQADFATAATGPGGIITALSDERNYQAVRSIGFVDAVALPVNSIDEAEQHTDEALRSFRTNLADLDVEAAASYRPAVRQVENGLKELRAEGDRLGVKPSLDQAEDGSALFGDYTELLHGLLDANGSVALPIDDAQLRTGVEILDELARQNDIEGRIIRDGAMAGLLKDEDAALEATMLAGAQQDGEERLRVLSEGAYAAPVLTVLNSPGRAKYNAAIESIATDPLSTDLELTLEATPRGGDDQLIYSQEHVAKLVDERAALLTESAEQRERNYAIAALGSLLLAIVLLVLTNRWITRPLRRLADEADEIATERLPVAVQTILDTPPNVDIEAPEVQPVSVRAGGEVREVANALNQVQDSALELAVEQAVLRRNIADAYVNLGRRNQNLLARQLEFISQLEDDAADPETLESLFKLDHLATRMRRNAESLLVLAGHEPPRTWSAPVEVGDVVRGALGEVEGYQRVRIRHVDDATIDGAAAADVSHVLAELVENALSFSPPDAEVDVFGRRGEGSYVLSIVDCGIGMPDDELDTANLRLAGSESSSVAPSRYLGHYVVGQLAARHGIAVQLSGSPAGGVTATLTLPPDVLEGAEPVVAPAPASENDDDASNDSPLAPLPPLRVELDADEDLVSSSTADALPRRTLHEPVVDEPVVDEPVVEEPPLDVPVLEEPVPEEPVLEEPVLEEPVLEHSEEPIEAILVDEPIAPAASIPFASPFDDIESPARPVFNAAPTFEPAPPAPIASEPALPAPPPPVLTPSAPEPPAPTHPEFSPPPPDHRATFAELAGAVDAISQMDAEAKATPSGPPPNATWSEDFLPQRLPKRSRKESKLKTPWARDARAPQEPPAAPPVTPVAAPASYAPPVASPPAPAQTPAPAPAPLPANPLGGLPEVPPASPEGAPGAVRFGPELPSRPTAPTSDSVYDELASGAEHDDGDAHEHTTSAPQGEAPADGSDERFAFFAAFRAAAERAREDAGIDTRRTPS